MGRGGKRLKEDKAKKPAPKKRQPVDDSSSEDEGPTGPSKKQKREAKKLKATAPEKLKRLPAREWTPRELTPFVRVVPLLKELPRMSSDAVAQLRAELGLRVPLQRTKICRFWQQGKCRRGAACGFAHSEAAAVAVECPPPVSSLALLPRSVGRAMLQLGFETPSPIQAQTWPAALKGIDLICRAPTGSGKTLAYLLHAAAHCEAQPRAPPAGAGPAVLVLVPTRELALQVHAVARSFRRSCNLRAACLYGGGEREEQLMALEGGLSLLVSTTGRLLDMFASKHLRFGCTTLLVIDEADTMLARGFVAQVSDIAAQLRPDRQTLLFSATVPEQLEEAASQWMRAPLRIIAEPPPQDSPPPQQGAPPQQPADDLAAWAAAVAGGAVEGGTVEAGALEGVSEPPLADEAEGGSEFPLADEGGSVDEGQWARPGDGVSLPPATVTQRFVYCDGGHRREPLLQELRALGHGLSKKGGAKPPKASSAGRTQKPRALVFVNAIKDIRGLSGFLRKAGVNCGALHGELSQREREDALTEFKAGKRPVLLASDVAARGVDIRQLACVINFDLPPSIEQYVHRAGRTGRQGAEGLSITLLRPGHEGRKFVRHAGGLLLAAGAQIPEVLQQALTAK